MDNRPLYEKYIVRRSDGKDEPGEFHDGCDYFVLDLTHDSAARRAFEEYAEYVHKTHPDLASSIRRWLLDHPDLPKRQSYKCPQSGTHHIFPPDESCTRDG